MSSEGGSEPGSDPAGSGEDGLTGGGQSAAENGPAGGQRAGGGNGPAGGQRLGGGNGPAGGQRAGGGNGSGEGEEPGRLLGELAALRRQARSARHAYWLPLLLFGLLSCVSIPFYVMASPLTRGPSGSRAVALTSGPTLPILGGAPMQGSFFLGYYWLIALVGGYLLCALWYRRHARLAGLQTPARGYVITGVVLTAAALLLPPLSQFSALHWLSVAWPGDLVVRGMFPFLIIAAGLWVLAWAERSRALAVTAVVFTGAALLANLYDVENLLYRLGWNPAGYNWQVTIPNMLLPTVVLLVAGGAAGVAAVAARRRRAAGASAGPA